MINLAGKTAVVFGLANKRSIAWGIAQKLHEAGATLAICYQNERMKAEAEDLIDELGDASGFQCDVSNDQEIATLFAALKEKYARIDILVHAIAYAPAEDLRGEFINTSREGFRIAHDVSVYSLIAVSRGALPLMTEGGSIITLTYYAAEKVVPHYNVMALAKASLESCRALPGLRTGTEEHPRERHLCRAHQDPGRARRGRVGRDAQVARGALPAAPQRRSERSGRHSALSGQRSGQRRHRRNPLRGLRLQHHGVLRIAKRNKAGRTQMPLAFFTSPKS